MFELRELSTGDGVPEYNMLQEIDENEYGFTNEVKGMSYNEYREWLVRENDYAHARNMPENWIPQTTYFFFADSLPVGIARIRHFSSDYLEKMGVGNFGYGIAKPYRGNGYGNALFLEVIKRCKSHGYTRVKSFVHIDNAASNRVFEKNGAKLIGTFEGTKNIYETTL